MKRILAFVLIALALATTATAEEAHFLKAIDGDSVLVEVNGIRVEVRLLCVDAPEHDQDPWGARAKAFVDEFCRSGGTLDLEYDLERHDRYNRLLAYVWQNGQMLNLELARAGLGFPVYYKPNKKHLDQIKDASAEAEAAQRGFFAPGVEIMLPAKWRKNKRK